MKRWPALRAFIDATKYEEQEMAAKLMQNMEHFPQRYSCNTCSRVFSQKKNWKRHITGHCKTSMARFQQDETGFETGMHMADDYGAGSGSELDQIWVEEPITSSEKTSPEAAKNEDFASKSIKREQNSIPEEEEEFDESSFVYVNEIPGTVKEEQDHYDPLCT